jgi:hypothetical protein
MATARPVDYSLPRLSSNENRFKKFVSWPTSMVPSDLFFLKKRSLKMESWQYSDEKKQLRDDILNELITEDDDIKLIHNMYGGIYTKFPLKNFKVNFKNLCKSIKDSKAAASRDEAILANTLAQRPPYPPWDASEARRLLLLDLASGAIANMKPSEVRNTRPEYRSYPEKKFRDNLCKERHKPIKKAYWEFIKQQRQQKMENKHKQRKKK